MTTNALRLAPFQHRTLLVFALLLTVLGASRAGAQQPQREFPASYYFSESGPSHRAMEGKPAPSIQIAEWIGQRVNFSELKGQVIVVDFWATWCGPCMAAVPHNNEMVHKHGKDGLTIIGVHDASRGWDKAPAAHRSKQMAYSIGLDSGGSSARAWKVGFWPTYAVVDRQGILRAIGLKPESVEQVVVKLLAEKGDSGQSASQTAGAQAVPPEWLEGTAKSRKRLNELVEVGMAPRLEVANWINSQPLLLEELKGKVVLLDFWTPSREASTRSMRRNNELFEKHKSDGLMVIGICHSDAAERMAEAASRLKITYPVGTDMANKTSDAYKVDNYPDSYLIDRAGTLRIADCKEARVAQAVELLLKEPLPAEQAAVPALAPENSKPVG